MGHRDEKDNRGDRALGQVRSRSSGLVDTVAQSIETKLDRGMPPTYNMNGTFFRLRRNNYWWVQL